MYPAVSEKKNYSLIGRILANLRPEVYHEIEQLVRSGRDTDLSRIRDYYSQFLVHSNAKGIESRRQFVAIMLKVYHPFVLDRGFIEVKWGFTNTIAVAVGAKRQSVDRDIKEVIVFYRAYDEFKSEVDRISQIIAG